MTDRELLELAAKAAGIEIWWTDNYGGVFLRQRGCPVIWNPITNDADALRLAVKTGLAVSICAGYTAILDCKTREEHGDDPLAATRRAIVRAAAEIGRSMK